jgi:hypothetical protein
MDSVMADLALESVWASEVRDFGEEAVDRCAVSYDLDVGGQRVGGLGRYTQRDSVQ